MFPVIATGPDEMWWWFVQDGLRITYYWIKQQIEKEASEGGDLTSKYSSSKIVGTQAPVQLGSLRAADGKEGL